MMARAVIDYYTELWIKQGSRVMVLTLVRRVAHAPGTFIVTVKYCWLLNAASSVGL